MHAMTVNESGADPVRVPAGFPAWPRPPRLRDRLAERKVLDNLLEAVRAGESRALVLHGDAGVGKTALLDDLAGRASGCRVVRTAAVQSEMELPFAGLHQLCAPMLDRLERLPIRQRDALCTAFGMGTAPAADRFLVGLAVLSLLSEVAEERPLVCLVDDHQWLDFASVLVLAIAARRLGAESVGLIFATRAPSDHLAGLPGLAVGGLPQADARVLLDSVLPGKLDARVRDQIVAETRGNPLALLELPRGLTPAELAVGLELPGAVSLDGSIEENFRRRVDGLPDETRRLLLVAAAEPTGDPMLIWRAAARLGISPDAAAPAAEAGLAEFETRVRFRHPLVRTAAYRSAPAEDRLHAHQALAEITDPQLGPERRAWHRAQAAPGPDEDVAAELERAAGLALARGCLAAAGIYLQRAATLSLDARRRAARALDAAQGRIRAGAFDAAVDLLAMAEAGPLNDLQRARVDLSGAQLAYVTNRGSDAPLLLLKAARRLEPVDAELSRSTYLDALSAAMFAGSRASPGGGIEEVASSAVAARDPRHASTELDLLLDGLATSVTQGYAVGVPMLRRALTGFGAGLAIEEELRWLWLASVAAMRVWDDDRWDTLSARHVQLARQTAALSELPLALVSRTYILLWTGDLAAAASLADETQALKEATGSNMGPYGALGLAALQGDETQTEVLIKGAIEDASHRGEGFGVTLAEWANAILHNGLGSYDKALAAGRRAIANEVDLGGMIWPLVELIEAAARTGATDAATSAHRRLLEVTSASGTDWALGLQARSYALLSEGEEAEHHYRESVARLGRTRVRTHLARAHLLYGEWLRRQRARTDAREHLRTAHRMFEAMGMEAFAERARREVQATGVTVHKRSIATRHTELTAQETQIARLARDGLTNPEIATRLFISAHTVQYHLRKVFVKLGVESRSQLDRVLPRDPDAVHQSRQAASVSRPS
jgi:DNA-binding CsgD family transcriptional regulator/tetratricopeptide (TPR) repeat protein